MSLIINPERIRADYPSCYACDDKPTGVEHAPPRCFFPEETDARGNSIYRKKLITVPSCAAHNTEKSEDDLYAVWHIANLIGTNHCAELVKNGVLVRAIERDHRERGGKFAKLLANEITGADGERVFGKLDAKRMVPFMKRCAQAIYFHEKVKILRRPLVAASNSNDFREPLKAKRLAEIDRSFDAEMNACERKGANPEVFQYAICEPDEDVLIIELIFYGTMKHWIFYHPEAERQIL
jgi:hypothetical protein